MINIGTLLATLKIKDQLTPALAKAQQSLKNVGPKMTAVGRSMTMGVTAPLVAAGAAAIKFAVDMNKAMANVATLIPGSTERVEELKKSVQDLAIETGKSTADLSDGLYQVVSAFGDTADTAKILELNAKAAAAGLATTSDAIALTSAVTKGYGDTSFEAMQKASDLAFTTVKLGQTSFPELAGAIGRVAISASGLKITQEELNTVFATMTGVTGNAAEVSTQFRGAMTGLKKPSEDMKVALKGIGFATGEAALASLGFQGTLKALQTQTGGNASEMAKLFESTESWDLIQGVASVNADKFTRNLEEMAGAAGATDEAFREQTEGINAAGHSWNQLTSSFTVILQQLGDELLPAFNQLVGILKDSVVPFVTRVIKGFSELSPTMQTVVGVVTGLVVAAGPLLVILGVMATAIAAVSLPVLGVVAAIGVVVAAFFTWRKEIIAFVNAFNNIFYGALDSLRVRLGKMTKEEAAAAKAQREFTAAIEDQIPVVEEVTAEYKAQAPALEQVAIELDDVTDSTHDLDDATKELNRRIDDQVTVWERGAIPAAEEAAAAFKRLGDLTLLTASEQKALSHTLEDGLEKYRAIGEEAPAAMRAIAAELRKLHGTLKANPLDLNLTFLDPGDLPGGWKGQARQFRAEAQDAMVTVFREGVKIPLEMQLGLPPPPELLSTGAKMGQHFTSGFKDIVRGIPGTIVDAIKGGGNALKAIGTQIGSMFGSGIGKALSSKLGSLAEGKEGMFGSLLGGLSGMAGPIGAAIGAMSPMIAGAFKKLFSFGTPAYELEARNLVETFEDTIIANLNQMQLAESGGERWKKVVIGVRDAYLLAGKSAGEAEGVVQRLWNEIKQGGADAVQALIGEIRRVTEQGKKAAGEIAELEAALKRLTDETVLGLQGLVAEAKTTGELLPAHLEPYLATLREAGLLTQEDEALLNQMADAAHVDWKAMQESAERYGVSLEELGPAFDRKRLEDAAQAIAADWDILNQEGVNTRVVLEGMSDSVQDLIDDALNAGVDIPANLQPVAAAMIAQGLLIDENGQALTDMSQLPFATPIEAKFSALILKIDELITRLIGPDGVTNAVGKVAQGVKNIPDRVTVDVAFNVQDFSLPDFDDIDIGVNFDPSGGYQGGTHGRYVDFGAGTPTILHGRERVMTEKEGRTEVASLGGVEKRLSSIERLLRDQPRAFGLAMSDTMNLLN